MGESTQEHSLAELFKSAIAIERQAGGIYSALLNHFSHVPELTPFWEGLIADETVHAKVLQEVYDSLTQEQLSSPADEKIWEKVVQIQNLLSHDLIGSIKNLDDAYELAHELEFSEVNVIFKFLTIEVITSEERSQFVFKHVAQHQGKLLDFSENYGNRDWRKQIRIQ